MHRDFTLRRFRRVDGKLGPGVAPSRLDTAGQLLLFLYFALERPRPSVPASVSRQELGLRNGVLRPVSRLFGQMPDAGS